MPENPVFQSIAPASPPPGFRPRTTQRTIDGNLVDIQIITIDVNGGGDFEALLSADNPLPVTVIDGTLLLANGTEPIAASPATDVIYSGTTPLTPMFAKIAAAGANDNIIVAAVAGKKIRVLKYTIVAAGAVAAKFASAAGGAGDLTGAMSVAANGGVGGAYCPVGLFETVAGEALVLNLSAGVSVAGHLTYLLA